MAGLSSTVSASTPPLENCEPFRLQFGETVIHAPGFEDRTMAVLHAVAGSEGGRAILLDYRPVNERNRLTEIRERLSSLGMEINDEDILPYDRFNPDTFEYRLAVRLQAQEARRVVVDISTMSKLAIMLVLEVCRRLDLDTRIVYAEADLYEPTQEKFELARVRNQIHRPTLQVFTGVHGVVRTKSLASVAMQGQPTAAIVFMSFNDALTQVLLNTVFPGRLFLINGRPPVHSWREAATAWIHHQVRREWEDDNPAVLFDGEPVALPKRTASTLDYRESVSILLDLYWELSATHRVLLAPSGSKMQAVGCYLARALHPDIHVEYPSPEGFAPEYSSGVAAQWIVNLGVLSQRLAAIAEAERHEYLEILP